MASLLGTLALLAATLAPFGAMGIVITGNHVSARIDDDHIVIVAPRPEATIQLQLFFMPGQRPHKPYSGTVRVAFRSDITNQCYQELSEERFENCTHRSSSVFVGCKVTEYTFSASNRLTGPPHPFKLTIRNPRPNDSGMFYVIVRLDDTKEPIDVFAIQLSVYQFANTAATRGLYSKDSCRTFGFPTVQLEAYLRTEESWRNWQAYVATEAPTTSAEATTPTPVTATSASELEAEHFTFPWLENGVDHYEPTPANENSNVTVRLGTMSPTLIGVTVAAVVSATIGLVIVISIVTRNMCTPHRKLDTVSQDDEERSQTRRESRKFGPMVACEINKGADQDSELVELVAIVNPSALSSPDSIKM
ncbi:envelope glycoprotein I [Gallid alphaherpesvirus 1]|nr:envelope glycoprotein I [Gallid alphaherpesvirus 1]AWL83313.1 envelope glycoprotein I [Gallid alphaherpesvirus 1]